MDRAEAAGLLLADRHREAVEPAPIDSVLDLGERPRAEQWTLRSALVRFAQPEPTRAAAVLDLVRRCEWALQPLTRTLESHAVMADRAVTIDRVQPAPGRELGWLLDAASEPYPDARTIDVARLWLSAGRDGDAVVDAYRTRIELEPDELSALPLLEPVLILDELAGTLAAWAPGAPSDPPLTEVDEVCHHLHPLLEALGATGELDPARRARPRRRPRPA